MKHKYFGNTKEKRKSAVTLILKKLSLQGNLIKSRNP